MGRKVEVTVPLFRSVAGVEIRVATAADLPAVVDTMTGAFYRDPVWAWAFPDDQQRHAQHEVWWGFLMRSAMRYDDVWTIDGGAAATSWIPPGGTELTSEEQDQVEPLLRELLGVGAAPLLEGLARFDENLPSGEQFYYLTMIGTHPSRRGEGIGMRLLGANLARIDAEHMPCYLESTNPVNDERYRRVGFERRGEFTMPGGGPTVTTMWRPARGLPGEAHD